MKTRRRIRGAIKWGGAVVTVLLLIVWAWSRWHNVGFRMPPTISLMISNGRLEVDLYERWSYESTVEWFSPIRSPFDEPFEWWFESYTEISTNGSEWKEIFVPIWFLALLTATPTFLIWRGDRRRPPGVCRKCGYSRTGLPADRACPECGTSPEPV